MCYGWLHDPRVSLYVKLLALVVSAYALSPVDLIPDFIPVFGYLDDLIIVPLGIWMVVSLIPEWIVAELRAEAITRQKPTSKIGLVIVLLIWLSVGLACWWIWWT